MASQPFITLKGVKHSFASGTEALEDISLTIDSQAFVSLVGPSGCGKSTLLRIMSGLIAPSSGIVDVGTSGQSGDVGFVFQDPTLMPWATVRANVALPLDLRGRSKIDTAREVDQALARVGLSDFAHAYPRELSGGMRMRVSIARAIVTKPRLLLMDEPFAALDEFTRAALNDELLSLWRTNHWTVVFVTHSIQEAVFLSQRLVVMSPRPGRIVGDLSIGLPAERTSDIRLGHSFVDECARVTEIFRKQAAGIR